MASASATEVATLDEAIAHLQRNPARWQSEAEWTTAESFFITLVCRENSVELQRILERHGWSHGHFGGRFDRDALLADLARERQLLAPLANAQAAPPAQEPIGHLTAEARAAAEARRYARDYILEEEKPIGEGTFGTVFKARCVRTERMVAVKKMKPEHEEEGVPSTAIREIAVLKKANHPNVVKLLDVICTTGHVHLIFEFVDHNLKEHMRRHGPGLEPAKVRSFMWQLMSGIDFCHSNRIMHRDLKPQNLLIDTQGTLKIADFGMARAFSLPIPKYTHEVVTTWYRAPEILFGCQEYSLAVDTWSAGCVHGEMATGAALFRGDSEIDTIFQVFQKLGTPSEAEWPGLNRLPDFKMTFPKWKRRPWSAIRNTAAQLGPNGVLLLDELLRYDPKKRISAKCSLLHTYFTDEDVVMES